MKNRALIDSGTELRTNVGQEKRNGFISMIVHKNLKKNTHTFMYNYVYTRKQ